MTAPVIHAPDKDAKIHVVSFVLPKDVSIKDIPLPADAQVSTIQVDPHYAAAIKFRGLANYEHFKSFGDKLLKSINAEGLSADGEPYYARFDPPWKPGILRRNEAIVSLKNYPRS
jgi:hypothetical protein